MRRATFEIDATGAVTILRPVRVCERANRVYADGHHPLTRHERMILRVIREVGMNPWLAGMDVKEIANRNLTPN